MISRDAGDEERKALRPARGSPDETSDAITSQPKRSQRRARVTYPLIPQARGRTCVSDVRAASGR